MSSTQRYYFGILIPDIAMHYGVKCTKEIKDKIHDWVKAVFSVESTRALSDYDFEILCLKIRVLFAEERGWVLKEKGDPDNVEEISLQQLIQHKLYENSN